MPGRLSLRSPFSMAPFSMAVALVTMVLGTACGSSSPSSSSQQEPTTSVSLRNDVLPIFAGNCSTTTTCHGSPTGIEVFLAGGASNATAIRNGIVNVASGELPTMPYVTAKDPDTSYILHKLDGDQHTYDAQCVGETCRDQMPLNSSPLAQSDRALIRAWITQGALDN